MPISSPSLEIQRAITILNITHAFAISTTILTTPPSSTTLIHFLKQAEEDSASLRRLGAWLEKQPCSFRADVKKKHDLTEDKCFVWSEIFDILGCIESLCENFLEEEIVWEQVGDLMAPFLGRGLSFGKCAGGEEDLVVEGKKRFEEIVEKLKNEVEVEEAPGEIRVIVGRKKPKMDRSV